MFVDIALQFILATIIGSIWAAPFVITPAARRTLDKEALKFFLRSFFFRLNLFLIVFLVQYLGIFYFFKLGTYELFFSNYEKDFTKKLSPVYDAIRITRKKLETEKSLISLVTLNCLKMFLATFNEFCSDTATEFENIVAIKMNTVNK